ncbi:MAG: hypothetical protein ACTSO8_01235 [Promethearchaeota archaeon]
MNLINKEGGVKIPINLNNLELNIGPKKITIIDRFTLILGKFKRELFQEYQNQDFIEVVQKLDLIPAGKLINLFQNQSDKLSGLESLLKILVYLSKYRKIAEYNLEVFSQFSKLIEIILLTFRNVYLSERKNQLILELELAKKHKKSSELSAIVDLINKLKESIKTNKLKLNYIKEDYFQRKNQIDQLKGKLANFEDNIRDLNHIKKTCFSHINRITRQIEGPTNNKANDSILKFGIENNLTNAEKIRALQKKAKETQYDINQIKSISKQVKEELEKLTPHYEIYKNDYEEILETIKGDENRIRKLQINYEKEINVNGETHIEDIKDLLETPIRTSFEIEGEISRINSELETISIPEEFFRTDNHSNLIDLTEKLREIDNGLKTNDEKISIRMNKKEVIKSFNQYNLFESVVKDLEGILNEFLKEVNLKMSFLLVINDTNTSFFLKMDFTRNKKEKANFEELTTPEKIFFIVSFSLSIGVLLGDDTIFFSNLFIPNIYNKGGSIYRTIRKILPLFETNEKLTKYKLIFLMSNLDLKKEINNIKIIKV